MAKPRIKQVLHSNKTLYLFCILFAIEHTIINNEMIYKWKVMQFFLLLSLFCVRFFFTITFIRCVEWPTHLKRQTVAVTVARSSFWQVRSDAENTTNKCILLHFIPLLIRNQMENRFSIMRFYLVIAMVETSLDVVYISENWTAATRSHSNSPNFLLCASSFFRNMRLHL